MADRNDINSELDALFERWQKEYRGENFFKDGIPVAIPRVKDSVPLYDIQEFKVLFILREPHAKGYQPTFDMRETVANSTEYEDDNGKKCNFLQEYRAWSPISVWAKALLSGENDVPQKADVYFRKKYLPGISFLNLKKSGGGVTSSNQEISAFAFDELNKKYLLEQIEILNPSIVITCGTFDIVRKLFDMEESKVCSIPATDTVSKWRKYFKVAKRNHNKEECIVFEYRHPSRSGSYKVHYENMLQIRRFAMDNRTNH